MDSNNNFQNFKLEIKELCKKYNVVIAHEDTHGGFEILEGYDSINTWEKLIPKKLWKDGNSAKTLAKCWVKNNGFPEEFKTAFRETELNPKILLAIPEYKVRLDKIARSSSHNDLFVLAKDEEGFIVIMVEGKVKEPFGSKIVNWKKNDSKENKKYRFDQLLETLGLEGNLEGKGYDEFYYQLFHRTASAVITAKKFGAKKAMMLVHSFCQKESHFGKFEEFAKLFINNGDKIKTNKIYKKNYYCIKQNREISLYLGWITGDKKYLIDSK